jgi:hypothetical protein
LVSAKQNDFLAEHYINIACRVLPVVAHTLKYYGDISLSVYLENFSVEKSASYQSPADLFEIVHSYTAKLLGEFAAEAVVNDLKEQPVILTANHLGVDYFAQSIQGTLIFALNRINAPHRASTVTAFSFGNVPLNNLTFPRGVLAYGTGSDEIEKMPHRIALFPDRLKRSMVSVTPAFDSAMVDRTQKRSDRLFVEKRLSGDLLGHFKKIFQKDYLCPSILRLPNYSQQSVVLNHRIWQRLFAENITIPQLIYLEIEEITSRLLASDLVNSKSLVHLLFFDQLLRKNLLDLLDGVKGCWNQEKLFKRRKLDLLSKSETEKHFDCGTHFFWGVDKKGRRISLRVTRSTGNGYILCGRDTDGASVEIPFTPQAIRNGCRAKYLLPSLFTCFLAVAFARGLVCVGGYHQCAYLPVMKAGIVDALQQTGGYENIARSVNQVPTNNYLSGMMVIMAKLNQENFLVPAGPLEIMAGGGVQLEDMERMLSLTLRDAHLAALFETVPDVLAAGQLKSGWKKQLAAECYHLLKNKVVIKRLG